MLIVKLALGEIEVRFCYLCLEAPGLDVPGLENDVEIVDLNSKN